MPQLSLPDMDLIIAALGAGVFAMVLTLVAAAIVSAWRDPMRRRLTVRTVASAGGTLGGEELLREARTSRFPLLDGLLAGTSLVRNLEVELARAHVPLRASEFLVVSGALAAVGAYLGFLVLRSPVVGVTLLVLGAAAPRMWLHHQRTKRIKGVERQLIDLLSLSSNSLKSGWGFMQAMAQVAEELPPPLSEEVQQALEEVSLGATPEQALNALAERIPSYDLELIITAVIIQRRTGGNLAEIMDGIAHTIRARLELLAEVRALTAESRMSAWVLAVLPLALAAILSAVNPAYLLPLIQEETGRLILGGAVVLEVIGIFVLRRLATLEV